MTVMRSSGLPPGAGRRGGDPATDRLPFVDEHRQRIDAPVAKVWEALSKVLRHGMVGSAQLARVLGCDPAHGTAEFAGRPGEAVPGFRVAAAEPGRRLFLRGRHRFADYALTFVLDGDHLCAQTHAAFPGLRGRLYRAAVIGSGAHRVVTRRLLRQVARAAEPPAGRALARARPADQEPE